MPLRPRVLQPLVSSLVVLWAISSGCIPTESNADLLDSAKEAIQGQDDATDTGTVAVFRPDLMELCSGSLIAPNLVLTARHCVSTVDSEPQCDTTKFGGNASAANVFVTTKTSLQGPPAQRPDDYHAVQKVVTGSDSAFCGNDVALLILSDNIASSEASPLVPRVDSAVKTHDVYSAIGFGTTDDLNGAGGRRRLDNLTVACADDTKQCVLSLGDLGAVGDQTEWHGSSGACEGDSGGPALDANGRIVGVLSRHGGVCGPSVYTSVIGSRADLITSTATDAAAMGKYTVPTWAKSSGCSVALMTDGPPTNAAPWFLGCSLAAVIAASRRFRRR